MSNRPPLGLPKEEIFAHRYWVNEKGARAINAKSNRATAESIMLFGQSYFKEHFPSKHPECHTEMLALMCSNYKFKAAAFPRGHSKSTLISFLLAIYRIVFMERKFIVIVSESEDKAKDFVIRLRDELEFNNALIRDFNNGKQFKTTDWSKTDFTTSTGIRVIAKGAGQSLRGLIHRDTRPDCIILDDFESDENAGTPNMLNFMLNNVFKSVNKRGEYDICYIGTIICDMAVLHQMLINDEFASMKVEAIDDNDEMIAPMLLPKVEYEREKRIAYQLGKMSTFYAEYHNNPMVADTEQTFKQEYFQFKSEDELDLSTMNVYIAYDPAMPERAGRRGRADRSSIIVLATDHTENWYVLRVHANRDAPSKNRQLLYNLVKKYQPVKVWMETIAAQRAMYMEIKEDMKRNAIKFPFEEIASQTGTKEARIEQLQPLYESGRVYHCKKDKEVMELERELLLFGRTSHDDRSDCLSFFLNRVRYPRKPVQDIGRAKRDAYARFTNKTTSASWKII